MAFQLADVGLQEIYLHIQQMLCTVTEPKIQHGVYKQIYGNSILFLGTLIARQIEDRGLETM